MFDIDKAIQECSGAARIIIGFFSVCVGISSIFYGGLVTPPWYVFYGLGCIAIGFGIACWTTKQKPATKYSKNMQYRRCADCGVQIGLDDGPPDGWQLEDGRTVCQNCCVLDLKKMMAKE